MKNLTITTAKELKSVQARKVATEMGIKNSSSFKKDELIKMIISKLESKEEKVSKSSLLREVITTLQSQGKDIGSGRLMVAMESKHNIIMHRSFVITVRNKFLSQNENLKA